MPKYKDAETGDQITLAPNKDGRPGCIKNIADIQPEPYDRETSGIAGIARDIGDATGTRLLGIDITEIPPGKKSSHLHRHKHKEEFFYVLSGKCRIKVGNDSYDLRPGDAVCRPANAPEPHQFYNPFTESCSVLMCGVMAGRGMEDEIEWPELKRLLVIDAEGSRKINKI